MKAELPDLTAEQIQWKCVQYPPCRFIGPLSHREEHLAGHKGKRA